LLAFAASFSGIMQKYDIQAGHPIGLCAASSDTLVFIIAACWINHIPFTTFDAESSPQERKQQIGQLQPGIIITDQPELLPSQGCLDIAEFKLNAMSADTVPDRLPELTANENAVFGCFFTSGTSGTPKVVPLKRRQMMAAARNSAQNIHPDINEYWLLCMPLQYIGGISIILRSLLYGSAVFRLPEFDVHEVAHLLSTNSSIAVASLVPTMLKRLLDREDFAAHHQLQAILLGGGRVPPALLKECLQKEIPVISSFGMTETCAQIAANPLFSQPENADILQSAGFIFAPNKVEIRNKSKEQVKRGSSGAIWLKGPQVFDGYRGNTESPDGGWFNTGDYGRLDSEGRLYIEARRTDLIVTGGKNVSPHEIETAIESIDHIKEAAVFGLPDEEWGQRVVAAVIKKPEATLNQLELRKALKEELLSFKIPKQVLFVDALPRTQSGKIQRSKLVDLVS
jgi:O-succinylbenzoic acid--CoA ligase